MNKIAILLLGCTILIIVSALFLPSLKNDFVNWDDDRYVIENTLIRAISFENLKNIFTTFYMGNYHPLSILSYALDYHFFKLRPFGYHLTNLFLHLLNCILVFLVIYMLSRSLPAAFITAILFGLHPLQVDSVAWVSERKGLLCVAFFLCAIITYIRYAGKNQESKYYYLSLLFFTFALLSKPMAVTLPLVLLVLDYFINVRGGKNIFIEKIPFFILAALFLIISVFSQGSAGAIRAESTNWLDKFMIASYCIIFYLSKIFLPVRLSCLYPYPRIMNSLPFIFFASFLICCLLIVLVFWISRHSKKIVFFCALFLATILPAIQFVPVGAAMVSSRYAYLPLVWISYALATGFLWLYARKLKYARLVRIFLLAILLSVTGILSVLTSNRIKVWKDGLSLWSDCLNYYPNIATAYNSRGTIFLKKGEYDRAYSDFKEAIKIGHNEYHMYKGQIYYSMDLLYATVNLANVYNALGKRKDAIATLEKAIAINANYEDAYFNLGNIYYSMGAKDKAIELYKKAVEINPNLIYRLNSDCLESLKNEYR